MNIRELELVQVDQVLVHMEIVVLLAVQMLQHVTTMQMQQVDDGSCYSAAEGFDCEGNCLSGTLVTVDGGAYLAEKSWDIADCDGNVLASGGAPFAGCVDLGDNFSIYVDSYGDGWDGTCLVIGDASYTVESGADSVIGSCGVAGCTDETADNYNADATLDDGSCNMQAEGFDCDGNCDLRNKNC